jgi:hypothetical protein
LILGFKISYTYERPMNFPIRLGPYPLPKSKTSGVTCPAAAEAEATMAATVEAVGELGEGADVVVVRLPPLSEDNPLHQDRKVRCER